jgi:hypothetical protein
MSERVAIDIDLRSITAVSTTRGSLCKQYAIHPAAFYKAFLSSSPEEILVLCEIAGPVMHATSNRDACPPGKRRWMIYNAAWVSELCALWENTRVATSTAWTKGYTEAARHAIAGIHPIKTDKNGRSIYADPHDVREVRAMLCMHHLAPQAWVPIYDYLEKL